MILGEQYMSEDTNIEEIEKKNYTLVKLSIPTICKNYNKMEGLAENHLTSEIKVKRLKYKNFEKLQSIPNNKQMQHAISILTGLSHEELGELDVDDVAEITKIIYGYMRKFMELANQMTQT